MRFDFHCWTNSDYGEELSFQVGGEYLDLTGHSFLLHIKSSQNASVTLKELWSATPPSEGIHHVELRTGFIQIRISRASLRALFMSAYPDTFTGDEIALPYDMLTIFPDGSREAWIYGHFYLNRGITNG